MKLIPNSVTRTIGRTVLKTKKQSPHIFFVGGIAGVVGATVLACRATLKLEKAVDEIRVDIQDVKQYHTSLEESFDEQEYYKHLGQVYIRSGVRLGKLYGPSVLLGTASLALLTGSHVQMTRRNTALTMTLASLSKAFDEYRIRVAEEYGKEKEFELHNNIQEEKIEKDGKKQLVKVVNPDAMSEYGRYFDSTNLNWVGNSEYNRIFIEIQQNYANDMLHARGHVFLNDVYDQLGFDRTPAGAVVGWVRGNPEGDGYIDFGLHDSWNNRKEVLPDFILDFNVDGVVYNLI